MKYVDFIFEILNSNAKDWTYHEIQLGDPTEHEVRCFFKNDMDIILEFGKVDNSEYIDQWIKIFNQTHAQRRFVDILYRGKIMYQVIYLVIKGVDMYFPSVGEPISGVIEVAQDYSRLVELLSEISTEADRIPSANVYKNFIDKAGIVESEEIKKFY